MAVAFSLLGILALGSLAMIDATPRPGTVTVEVLPPSKPATRAVALRATMAPPYRLRTSTL